MRQKKLLLTIICLLALTYSSVLFAAGKVGYINLQRLVNESEMGKSARADIQKMRQEKEATLSDLANKAEVLMYEEKKSKKKNGGVAQLDERLPVK